MSELPFLPGAVIFDMDGVIIDSEPLHKRVFLGMAQELGFSCTDQEYERFTGRSPLVQWRHVVQEHNLSPSPEDLARDQVDRYLNFVSQPGTIEPMPGLVALLQELQARSIGLALASSNDRKVVDTVPKALGVDHFFSAMVSGQDVTAPKPDPEIFLVAARKLGAATEQCMVVEDAANGVAAAKAANMYCLALDNPNSGSQDLSMADRIIPSLDAFTQAIAALSQDKG
ncbi:MAG: HAD family phosphatase [Desulfovibrio sp.]|nr:MAG: HAD family phosphatase [Desulfovibrio sp.]